MRIHLILKREEYPDLDIKIFSFLMYTNFNIRQINKTINVAQNTNSRIDKFQNIIDRFSWALIQKNYEQLSNGQIQKEYNFLRRQIFKLNSIVAKQLQRFQRKLERKKLITQVQPDKVNQITQKQIQNNVYILSRMKKQYKGLKNKQQTIQPRQQIQDQIQYTKAEISNIKQKINSIKLKNKNIGDDIMNTDKVLEDLKQAEREEYNWLKKRNDLKIKLDKTRTQYEKVLQCLNKISSSSVLADNFIRNKHEQKRNVQQLKKLNQQYQQKLHSIQVFKKNSQIFIGLKQQKYHHLLKLLQSHVEKDRQMQIKTKDTQYGIIQYFDQIKVLQKKLKTIKAQSQRKDLLQSFLMEHKGQKSIRSEKQSFTYGVKSSTKFNLLIRKRHESNSSRISSTKKEMYRKSLTKDTTIGSQKSSAAQKLSTQQNTEKIGSNQNRRRMEITSQRLEDVSSKSIELIKEDRVVNKLQRKDGFLKKNKIQEKDKQESETNQKHKIQRDKANIKKEDIKLNNHKVQMQKQKIEVERKSGKFDLTNKLIKKKENSAQVQNIMVQKNSIQESKKQRFIEQEQQNLHILDLKKNQNKINPTFGFHHSIQKKQNTPNQFLKGKSITQNQKNQIQNQQSLVNGQHVQNISIDQAQEQRQSLKNFEKSLKKQNLMKNSFSKQKELRNELPKQKLLQKQLQKQKQHQKQKQQKNQFSMQKLNIDLWKIEEKIQNISKQRQKSKQLIKQKTKQLKASRETKNLHKQDVYKDVSNRQDEGQKEEVKANKGKHGEQSL